MVALNRAGAPDTPLSAVPTAMKMVIARCSKSKSASTHRKVAAFINLWVAGLLSAVVGFPVNGCSCALILQKIFQAHLRQAAIQGRNQQGLGVLNRFSLFLLLRRRLGVQT